MSKCSTPTLFVALLAVFALPGVARAAETPGPGWELVSQVYPTNLPPGGEGEIVIDVLNVGAGPAGCTLSQYQSEFAQQQQEEIEGVKEGRKGREPECPAASPHTNPVTVTDTLPPGLEATEAGKLEDGSLGKGKPHVAHELWNCSGRTVVTCTNDEETLPFLAGGGGGLNDEGAGGQLDPQIAIGVRVKGASGTETNQVTIAGGGAPTPASTTDPVTISSSPPSGLEITGWDGWFSNANGTIDTQAGSHPYEATFSLDFATEVGTNLGVGAYHLAGDQELKNIEPILPPGFLGDPGALPQCTEAEFVRERCPMASQIGLLQVVVSGGGPFMEPVFNMVPPAGTPAEFAANIVGVLVKFEATVRSGGDYGISEHIDDIPRKVVVSNVLTLWGVPADPSHNLFRRGGGQGGCDQKEIENQEDQECKPSTSPLKPFLTLPTACGEPQPFSVRVNTWQNENVYTPLATFYTHNASDEQVGFTGCENLQFGPAISTAPDTADADTPAGMTVEVKPPLGGLAEPEGLSPTDIQNTTVTLPQGVVINPGQAAGLKACQSSEDGLTTEAEKAEGRENDGPPSCPLASKVGTVKIRTPLLEGEPENELEGDVYVLQSNPPELKLLVAASADGVNIKLVGVVHLNETGQLTTRFEGTPELPFTNFVLSFSGGEKAALDTPTRCGMYGPGQGFMADFQPWSSPLVADAFPSAFFDVEHGPGGGSCPSSPLPFSPQLTAGSTTDQAGGYTDFSLLLQRGDGQQRIDGLQFKAPEGLTGFLSHVPLCTNAQAEADACPAVSKIGHTVVESGPGPYPLVVPEPGQEAAPIYLTESYGGAPFGLSIVVPLHVGPFTLPTQRVRARIEVDPRTSALTVTTDPLPQVVAGVPTDLREIDAVIERPEFMVNPTNCSPQEFSGLAYGTAPPGQNEPSSSAPISSHFQVGACRSLEFAPKFSVSTSGRTSKSLGASLTTKVTYPSVPQGTDADIGAVKVELPKQLPSRLTTLQKACTGAQFEADPAGCPSASFIGHAVVHTPLLPVPLTGPAIFVSHGGEAFPSLEIVLQGDGVTVDLVGATFISKAGITSTTFHAIPDDPFSTFELTLPEGKYSALAANGNLCASTRAVTVKKRVTVRVKGREREVTRKVRETLPESLQMPNEFVGQNGAVIKRDTKVTVVGCPKAKRAAVKPKAKKKSAKKKGAKKKG
jgi:hypothetical protein